ncbi:DUF6984 family protein [Cupriavidus metallidurans]|uniref:DUF6984 domain-containing protein n=2 Tax=Cupriavidus metallidurans TaxID=119219 RepID=Q1LEC4_CUPMC|nr:hypothetical protein Rmet_4640 [Cupriavidus metallidurans CH34]
MTIRTLNEAEIVLIRHMLRGTVQEIAIANSLPTCLVEEMTDDGIGSLRFDSNIQARLLCRDICKMEFPDFNAVRNFVTLLLDNYDELFDLNVWNADFSPLKQFPQIRPASGSRTLPPQDCVRHSNVRFRENERPLRVDQRQPSPWLLAADSIGLFPARWRQSRRNLYGHANRNSQAYSRTGSWQQTQILFPSGSRK